MIAMPRCGWIKHTCQAGEGLQDAEAESLEAEEQEAEAEENPTAHMQAGLLTSMTLIVFNISELNWDTSREVLFQVLPVTVLAAKKNGGSKEAVEKAPVFEEETVKNIDALKA